MVTDQTNITQHIAQAIIEAAKAAVQAMVVPTIEGSSEVRNEPKMQDSSLAD